MIRHLPHKQITHNYTLQWGQSTKYLCGAITNNHNQGQLVSEISTIGLKDHWIIESVSVVPMETRVAAFWMLWIKMKIRMDFQKYRKGDLLFSKESHHNFKQCKMTANASSYTTTPKRTGEGHFSCSWMSVILPILNEKFPVTIPGAWLSTFSSDILKKEVPEGFHTKHTFSETGCINLLYAFQMLWRLKNFHSFQAEQSEIIDGQQKYPESKKT